MPPKSPEHDQWMEPLAAVPGVRVRHRIDVKLWQIETPEGVLIVTLNWRAGDMRARLEAPVAPW